MTTPIDPETSAIIEMAWDDETSFDAIEAQTGLKEKEVIAIMRREMKPSSFRMWRKRVTGRSTKHKALTTTRRSAPPAAD
jgi:uncharacterized protein (TIGR03643 family)